MLEMSSPNPDPPTPLLHTLLIPSEMSLTRYPTQDRTTHPRPNSLSLAMVVALRIRITLSRGVVIPVYLEGYSKGWRAGLLPAMQDIISSIGRVILLCLRKWYIPGYLDHAFRLLPPSKTPVFKSRGLHHFRRPTQERPMSAVLII